MKNKDKRILSLLAGVLILSAGCGKEAKPIPEPVSDEVQQETEHIETVSEPVAETETEPVEEVDPEVVIEEASEETAEAEETEAGTAETVSPITQLVIRRNGKEDTTIDFKWLTDEDGSAIQGNGYEVYVKMCDMGEGVTLTETFLPEEIVTKDEWGESREVFT